MSCAICGAESAEEAPVAGLAVGAHCAAGELGWVRTHTDWTVDEESRSEPRRDANGRVVGTLHRYRLEVSGSRDLGLKTTFKREGVIQRVRKWLIREPQVGDQHFDDLVYVQGADGESLRKLLTPGAQAAILDLVSRGGVVGVQGRRVWVEAKLADPIDPTHWRLSLLCLKTWAARVG